jgi:CHASE3 domain
LQQVVTDRLDEVHSTIDEEHAGHPDVAPAIVNSYRGLKMMKQIHQLVSEIESGEDRLLTVRQATSSVVATLLQVGAATAFVLICVIGVLVCIYIWRSFAELKAAHDQLAVANEQLIEELQQREQSKVRLQLACAVTRRRFPVGARPTCQRQFEFQLKPAG